MFWTILSVSSFLRNNANSTAHLLFPSFEDGTIIEEERLHLIDRPRCHEDEVENGEQSELKIKRTVADHPKREAGKECIIDMQQHLIPHVVGAAPQLYQLALCDKHNLVPFGDGIIFLIGLVQLKSLALTFLVKTCKFFERSTSFVRFEPGLSPIDSLSIFPLHNINDVLCRVRGRRTGSSILREIVEQNL